MKLPTRLPLVALALAAAFALGACDDSEDNIMTDTPGAPSSSTPDKGGDGGELTEGEAYDKSKDLLDTFGG